jgi:predicted RNA-binding protein with TRAM domain
MVIPAGRQHDGDKVVQMFHIIVEDLEGGECNGEYSLISETELLDKYNLNFNN